MFRFYNVTFDTSVIQLAEIIIFKDLKVLIVIFF